VDEFGDLVAIHERLSDARAQASLLEPLPELDKTIKDACVTFDHLTEEKQGLPIYLGHIFCGCGSRSSLKSRSCSIPFHCR
jgi:uncharacterized protein YPO0396